MILFNPLLRDKGVYTILKGISLKVNIRRVRTRLLGGHSLARYPLRHTDSSVGICKLIVGHMVMIAVHPRFK